MQVPGIAILVSLGVAIVCLADIVAYQIDPLLQTNPLAFSTTQVGMATAVFAVVFGLLVFWRQKQALDHTHNNSGLFAWSSLFYREGGAVTDFLNASPYIINPRFWRHLANIFLFVSTFFG